MATSKVRSVLLAERRFGSLITSVNYPSQAIPGHSNNTVFCLFAGTLFNFNYIVYGVPYENCKDGSMAEIKDALVLTGAHRVAPLQGIDTGAEAINPSRYSARVAKVGALASMDVGEPILSKRKTR
ncbi:MAG: hypothetical protein O7I42_24810 [Alphaproteobacteria bacterium]|nr:hypothetical protein [Alphaproteobacteria bacterium]